MPVLEWSESKSIGYSSVVRTTLPGDFGGEEHRQAAQALDKQMDAMLDNAVRLTKDASRMDKGSLQFVRRWSLGRALDESGLMGSTHLNAGEEKLLWEALGNKCRLSVTATAQHQPAWQDLIPPRETNPQRIERDVFARGLWLQQQDLEHAATTFGANLKNQDTLHARSALRSLKLRDALRRWFNTIETERRTALWAAGAYLQLTRALASRWPGSGPGSAKRPIHYDQKELYDELKRVLDPVAETLLHTAVSP